MKTVKELRELIENTKTRSAWGRAKKVYALELLEDMPGDKEFFGSPADNKELLNGADDWQRYSEGGCSLVYNRDIAERVCTPSEYKRTKEGRYNPNKRETWIDCQARALRQASKLIMFYSRGTH